MPPTEAVASRSRIWTLVIVSVGLFMVVLDNLVVNVALPSIHRDLGASMQSLEWTVNAYVLAYAVLLLTGAALGDRFGRKRMFIVGIALFTAASAGRALAPTIGLLIAARALQGVGARDRHAADADPAGRRLPARKARPRARRLVGDQRHRRRARPARRRRRDPARLLALDLLDQRPGRPRARPARRPPAARRATARARARPARPGARLDRPVRARLRPDPRPDDRLDRPRGPGLARRRRRAAGRLRRRRSCAPRPDAADGVLQARSFAVTNVVSLSMYFGMFGSIFFLSQFLQNVLGNTPLQAGLKLLVWTGATMLVSPLPASSRSGSGAGCSWSPASRCRRSRSAGSPPRRRRPDLRSMIIPFILAGAGMALVFAPSASAMLTSVRTDQAGQASGATNAIRELGGVFGIAVLSTVFSAPWQLRLPAGVRRRPGAGVWVGAAVGSPAPWSRRAAVRHAGSSRQSRARAAARGPGFRPQRGVGSGCGEHSKQSQQRVPAAERRDALIEAAIHQFAHGGLHGTPVDRIAAASASPSPTSSACSRPSATSSSPRSSAASRWSATVHRGAAEFKRMTPTTPTTASTSCGARRRLHRAARPTGPC